MTTMTGEPLTAERARQLIENAASPAELFDGHTYRQLAGLVHPDRNPGDPAMAAAYARLTELRDQHLGRVPAGSALLARGDIADLFRTGTLLAGTGAVASRMGVTRTYMIRHGPGPFVTEDPALALPEPHNVDGPWQGPVRQGHFDAIALQYALAVAAGADEIALTHADTAAEHDELRLCRGYDGGGPVPCERVADWPQAVRQALGVPVTVVSYGPAAEAKRTRHDHDIIGCTPATLPAPPFFSCP